jgi:hypothetical protein
MEVISNQAIFRINEPEISRFKQHRNLTGKRLNFRPSALFFDMVPYVIFIVMSTSKSRDWSLFMKIHSSSLRVRSASLADLRMRIFYQNNGGSRIFRSEKIANFGGIIFAIVYLFRLGSNGF